MSHYVITMSHRYGEQLPAVIPPPICPGLATGRCVGRCQLHVFGAGAAAGLRLPHQPQEEPATYTNTEW